MSHLDATLNSLVSTHVRGEPLPPSVAVHGEHVETKRFLERFRTDRREAWPAITRHVHSVIERPLVCECALSLLGR